MPLAVASFSVAEEHRTLYIGAVVLALLLLGHVALVLWKAGWKRGRRHEGPDQLDHAAIGRGILLRLAFVVLLVGPFLALALVFAGGLLIGLATILGASLLVGTLFAAAIVLAGSLFWGARNLEEFLGDKADYVSARRVKAVDREMAKRLRAGGR